MDLDQDKIVIPEERHKWNIPELPPVPKAEGVGTSSKSLDRQNELLYSSEEVHGPRIDRGSSGGWKPMSFKGQVQKIKAWLKFQSMLSKDQKKKLAQGKDNNPVEAPQASTSKHLPQQVPNKGNQTPKSNKKGKKKEKGKAKPKCNKPYPQKYIIPKKEKTVMENVLNMATALMEFKNKEVERMNQSFPKR
ncbi:hypothetical protein O181_036783 [Austropuccinia psidii MF-1]|uniref:Uncharacterized protein n=1 Tax=Austropuccinia psidii MF-1 TaxID=1389203 RepID=A0A9Q3DA43_9BASI|nr:hypothetical protein [Austropuccinia psidii MF-1]